MRFGFQHLSPHAGHESTLLWFERGGQTDCVLVDAGGGVDLERHLGEDDYLAAALLTHAHIDHYRSLGKNLRHGAPVYASPGTAAALEHSLAEADKDNDVGDVASVLEALEPVDGWTTLVTGSDAGVDAVPVPAGHAVGAAGFLVRIRDEPLDGPRFVLATGDFTRRPCAGNPGLPADLPADLKAAFVNVATSESFERTLTESVGDILEAAFGGSRVVAATNGTTGVHYAYLLGHAAAALDRALAVTVVGQVARLYEALSYDVPNVRAVPVFDRTSEVLEAGGVTVAGPEAPTKGSSGRLFGAVRDDPAALFAQVTTGGAAAVSGTTCRTRHYAVSNHPTDETLDAVVEDLDPENVVVQHTRAVEQYRERYPRNFVWASDRSERYALYADGEWLRPEWMSDHGVRTVEMQRYGGAGISLSVEPAAVTPPSLSRSAPDLGAEGLDVERLRESFSVGGRSSTRESSGDSESPGRADAGRTPAGSAGAGDEVGEDGGATTDETAGAGATDAETADAEAADVDATDVDATETVEARVLRGDDGVTLLQLLEEVSLPDGARVHVAVDGPDDGGEAAGRDGAESGSDGE